MKKLKDGLAELLVVFVIIAVFVLIFVSVARGSERKGRIDIASGRVKATQVVNADGLTEWKFEEAHK